MSISIKINTALSLQRDMTRYWQTDVGANYALGCAEVARYSNTPNLLPTLWNVGQDEQQNALPEDRTALAATLTHRTRIATTYWTAREMVELTRVASPGRPGTAIFTEDMPHMYGFAVFEEPMIIDMAIAGLKSDQIFEELIQDALEIHDGSGESILRSKEAERSNLVNLAGFQWSQSSNNGAAGVDVILFSHPKDTRDGWIATMQKGRLPQVFRNAPPLLVMGSFFIPYGKDFEDDDVWHSIVATWWHLITQPIASTSVQNANPEMTKKARKLDMKPDITVVTLRPRKPMPKEDPANKRIVDWSHRWLVGANEGGFWRQQWYPSLGVHKAIHIGVYEKGPLDKPLVITRKKIYAWRR